jgi:isoquinoline 1-oxidoreductase
MSEITKTRKDAKKLAVPSSHTRRDFLKRTGGGIMVFFTMRGAWSAERAGGKPGDRPDFNAYLRIHADGKITGFCGKIEMGQGVMTSLCQMLADEMDAPMASVSFVLGDTALCPWDSGTWGSMTTRFYGPALRLAAAEARGIMLQLAAEHLGVSQSGLTAKDGVVSAGAKKVTYGELAKGKTIERYLEVKPELKDFADFKVSGKSHNRVDGYAKVTGRAQYTGDFRLPGMVYGKILRPPDHRGKLKSADTSKVSQIEGAEVVRDGDFIGVVHPLPDMAEKAIKLIKAEWDIPEAVVDDKNIYEFLLENAPDGDVAAQHGDIAKGKAASEELVTGIYNDGYVAHAPIETHTALAHFEGDQLTVWSSSQTPYGLQQQLADSLGMPKDKVRIISQFLGGGFGGKIYHQQAPEAVRLAKLTGKPVQVAWSRPEEFFMDMFRPAGVVQIESGIAEDGKMTNWDFNIYGAGARGSEMYYSVPNHRTTVKGGWGAEGEETKTKLQPLQVGAWRAPDNSTNTWARESHMDMMAAKAGMDALDFRLKNLTDHRMIRTLKLAADKFGWTPGKAPSGRGWGIATGIDVGAYVALMAEVEVDEKTGKVAVKRVVCAQDMGQIINPEGATIQCEGCVAMGLGYALTEHVRFKGAKVIEKSFVTYRIPIFSHMPEIEIHLVEADELPPQGGGEPPIICMGGVVGNGIFDATGARVYHMPMTPKHVKEALALV